MAYIRYMTFVLTFVHLLKNIRNNWLTEKMEKNACCPFSQTQRALKPSLASLVAFVFLLFNYLHINGVNFGWIYFSLETSDNIFAVSSLRSLCLINIKAPFSQLICCCILNIVPHVSQVFHCFNICSSIVHYFVECFSIFITILSASIRFCVLNSMYGFSNFDWSNSNTRRIFFTFKPTL